jgi:quinol monooxygenase YgiN
MLHVVARIVALPGKEDEFKALAVNLVELSRKEAGCIKYELLQNQSDSTDFTFVEEWVSDAALDAHLATPHFLAAAAKLDGLVCAAPDIRRYQLLM